MVFNTSSSSSAISVALSGSYTLSVKHIHLPLIKSSTFVSGLSLIKRRSTAKRWPGFSAVDDDLVAAKQTKPFLLPRSWRVLRVAV
jgi:hypothetical protein